MATQPKHRDHSGLRLARFRVNGLFGLFNHDIPFNLEDRITIIHAPNGYGKTIILKIISSFFGDGPLTIFGLIEFEEVAFAFTDGTTISVTQKSDKLSNGDTSKKASSRPYTFSMRSSKSEHKEWSPFTKNFDPALLREIPPNYVERFIPFLHRTTPREWMDTRVGDTISLQEAFERYWELLPETKQKIQPEWLRGFRSAIDCRLIETQRLMMLQTKDPRTYDRNEPAFIPTVKTYSDDLAISIRRTLAESATLSQSLDRTFPNRLLNRLSETTQPLSESSLRIQLAELERRRARLINAGLLDKSDDSALIQQTGFEDPTKRVLMEYLDDSKRKLDVFTDLLSKIELFTEIINSRFQFKRFSVSRNAGFVFQDVTGRKLTPTSLSSGEQHEIILAYEMLFKTKMNTMILIDEPEISLHVAWQRKFLSDLKRIIALSPMDVVLSTHSPQLIGNQLHLTVALEGPQSVKPAAE